MAVFFRINIFNAALGCAIALFAVYPAQSRAWLSEAARPARVQCAKGLPICSGFSTTGLGMRSQALLDVVRKHIQTLKEHS